MTGEDAYTMLVSSLPYHGPLFGAKQPPLSRIKLDQRLRMLTPEDRATLETIENALQWDRLPLERSDEEFVARARQAIVGLDDGALVEVMRQRLELRTLVAALRRRARGDGPPAGRIAWGYGRWLGAIARNWGETTFGIGRAFPWAAEADRLLRAGDAVGLERLLLDVQWRYLGRAAAEHPFNLVAVVVYVLKWNVIDRWTHYDAEAASRRFAQLIEQGLAPAA